MPVLQAKTDTPCVNIPPIPSYLFAWCCGDNLHCTNAGEPGYSTHLLSEFLQMRSNLIKQLVGSGPKKFKVLDAWCTTTCTSIANTATRLSELKHFTAKDGIHFIPAGYKNLAARTVATSKTLLSSLQKPSKPQYNYWRGFKSPVGSTMPPVHRPASTKCPNGTAMNPPPNARGAMRCRLRGFGFHPYKRKLMNKTVTVVIIVHVSPAFS